MKHPQTAARLGMIAVLLSVFVLGARIGPVQIIGGVLILGASVVCELLPVPARQGGKHSTPADQTGNGQ